ncbi:unnamed protein product, partial [Amoebophrya sp. A25]|eukprot:GSA25T00006488001.1
MKGLQQVEEDWRTWSRHVEKTPPPKRRVMPLPGRKLLAKQQSLKKKTPTCSSTTGATG